MTVPRSPERSGWSMRLCRGKRDSRRLRAAVWLGAAVGGVLGQSYSSAATIAWDGGTTGSGTAWLTATNWVGDIGPNSTDTAQFSGTSSNLSVGINMNGATNNGFNNQAVG